MGGDIVPDFVDRGDAGVYDLQRNEVPGSTDRDQYYWRDVGTIDSFFDAHMDLIAPVPVFNLYNQDWPIFNQQTEPAAGEVRAGRERQHRLRRSTRSCRSAASCRARRSSAA